MTPAWCVVGLVCGGVLFGAPLHAAEEPVDPALLEFLGSVDSSEAGWHDYLAVTNVDELVKSQGAPAKSANPGSPPPADDSGKETHP